MDKLRALRYFLKVAQTSNFTSAAKSFGVPASSVSRRIQDLETELGVELFFRSTRVVRLTALGQVYHDHVQTAVAAIDHGDEIVSQKSKIPTGTLRITAMPGYGKVRLLPVLETFRDIYPQIILDVELTDQVADLAQSETDIAIRASANLPERSVARRLSGNRFVLLASPNYLKMHGMPSTLIELLSHRALLYRGPNGILHWQAQVDHIWQELQMSPAFISNDGSALLEAVVAGQGVALLPEWGISKEIENKRLVEITLSDANISVTRASESGIFLLYNRPKYSVNRIKVAVEFLVSHLSV
ncbi:MAG: LysR substrate-binding domain-containing protein [Sneathiella sp.]